MCVDVKKKIAIIRSSIDVGGPGKQTIATVKGFLKKGYYVLFITGGGSLLKELPENKEDFEIHVLPELLVANRKVKNIVCLLKKLNRIIHKNKIQYVYGLNSYSTLMMYIASGREKKKIKYLNTLVGSGKDCLQRNMPFVHTVCSENQKLELIKKGYSQNKLFVNYPTTLDMDTIVKNNFDLFETREQLKIPQNAVVIGTAMMNDKGSSSFYEVVEKLLNKYDELYFVFIGNSEKYAENYCKINKKNQNRVKLLGVREDIFKIISSIDIFSHLLDPTEYETFGMVITEAMAYRKPVVASKIGGICNIVVDGETGFLVNNNEEYYKRISLLVEDPSERIRMGGNAQKRVEERFTISQHISRLEEIYSKI